MDSIELEYVQYRTRMWIVQKQSIDSKELEYEEYRSRIWIVQILIIGQFIDLEYWIVQK